MTRKKYHISLLIYTTSSTLLFLFFIALNGRAQNVDNREESNFNYYDENEVQYTNRVYDESIKTVLTYIKGSELESPIISLSGEDQIVLRFDDLKEDFREMHYEFIHCSWDWKPSDLQPMDYQEGYNSDIIFNYDFSFNTVRNYTHYYLEFPNKRINLTRSGNYIIKVYADGNADDLILTSRFMVMETKAMVNAVVHPSNVVSDREYNQEIDIEVTLGNINTTNPYRDIELVVLQNQRWDNMITNVKPNFIKNEKLTYNYQGQLDFAGGNEFRFFDAKSLRYRSEEVEEVRFENDTYEIILAPDWSKAFKKYTFENDINGKFLIKNDDMSDPHLESDYVTVHFQFPVEAMLGNGDLYLMGQLSDWQLKKTHRMKFNADNLSYEISLFLKQGYYNYAYVWRFTKSKKSSSEFTDGNHSETENDYLILVYFKDQSNFSDRLIGVEKLNSLN
ncbi:MAG: DUF5103 domain-containing protein [Flavobacteriales bacterium]|nr:DUF5103 domain-containing protein [Flavobacteriales bacterium]